MLLGMVAVCLMLGFVVRKARDQQHFVDLCEDRGWAVFYEYEYSESGRRLRDYDRSTNKSVLPKPYGPEVLRSLGHAYFNRIRGIRVQLDTHEDHKLFTHVASQPSITFLLIRGTFQKNDLEAITSMPRLAKLEIEIAALTPDEIRSISHYHPECDVYIRIMQR